MLFYLLLTFRSPKTAQIGLFVRFLGLKLDSVGTQIGLEGTQVVLGFLFLQFRILYTCVVNGLEALDDRFNTGQDRKVLALVTQPCQVGVKVLEVDEKALLGNGCACHGVCSFRCVQIGAANPLMILSRPV